MNNNDTLGVALVKELCPICRKEVEGPIVMNTRLTKSQADNVKNMHGKVIGWADKPCKECQGFIDKNYTAIIGIDETQSLITNNTISRDSEYRIGMFWIDTEHIKNVFGEETFNHHLKDNAIRVDVATFNMMTGKPSLKVEKNG